MYDQGLSGSMVSHSKPVFEHPVRVVSIEGGRIEKLENHSLNEFGICVDQGFPVLENVPPIPLIIKDLGAVVFVAQIDRKSVPRSAGITVAPAEFQGQILCG